MPRAHHAAAARAIVGPAVVTFEARGGAEGPMIRRRINLGANPEAGPSGPTVGSLPTLRRRQQ
jgi:hypothetical protein